MSRHSDGLRYWPKLDCDISSACLLRGAKEARRYAARALRKKAQPAATGTRS